MSLSHEDGKTVALRLPGQPAANHTPETNPDVTLPDQLPGVGNNLPNTLDVTAEVAPPSGPDQTVEHFSEEVTRPGSGTVEFRPGSPASTAEFEVSVRGAWPTVTGYEILGELGRGGMGVVYKAMHQKLHRLVALKMVLAGAHASPLQLARFATEAEAVARLQHPSVVQIYEVGEHDGLPYFSLEYVDGGSLSQKIGGKPQPPREAAFLVELLAHAMAVAHERDIVHRDLKPANVLLTKDGLPKITDFGMAKRLEEDSSQTKSGTLMGTPSYMSPEQARGDTHDIGPLSDLYSLGAILYELLTGRAPFVGTTMLETVLQVRSQEPVPPTRLQPKCPRDLETVCLKCLQKEPEKRYADCGELAEDLRRFRAGEPIHARPVGRLERSWRWCRRNPRVAALSATVGVLLLAVAASLSVVAVRVSRDRAEVADARSAAGQRFAQAREAVAGGDSRRAQELLRNPDPLLSSHPDLADVRAELQTLTAQVGVYAEFRRLLDSARFSCRSGSRRDKEAGRRDCRALLALYDEIEGRTGRGAAGMPTLNADQEQLFKEDVFEALLTAALVERELAAGEGDEARRAAARQAVEWLGRAENVLPDTKALYVNRAPCWAELGDDEANRADMDRARAIKPVSAVDHFWHGFANHLRGDEALRKKDAKAANEFYRLELAEYAAFLQQRPEHFRGYFNWANCHAQLNERHDLHDAVIGYTACIRLRPDFPWPYNNRGTAHLRLGDLDLAVADFDAALARNGQYAEAYVNRGLAHRALSQPDRALEDFGRAVEHNPDLIPAYTERVDLLLQRKQHAEAVGDLTRLLALGADKEPIYQKRAAAYRALGKGDEAAADYGELVKLNGKNLQARADRAEMLISRARYGEAKEELSAILVAAPGAAPIWRARAILHWQNLKDFDAALADFEQFAKLAPKDPEPHRCIGAILLGRRQYGPALEALQKALDRKPGYPEAIRAQAHIRQRQGKGAEILPALDALVGRLPEGLPDVLNTRGGVYEALGRPDAAADYRRMIGLKPKDAEAYASLARLLARQGDPKAGAECLDRLVAAAPESEWAYLRRAEYRRARGDFDAALADCAEAARLKPGWALPELVRAGVEAAAGRRAEAVERAGRALAAAPENDGRVLYAAACVWSLASRAPADPGEPQADADRAADLLTRALDKGFHDLSYAEHNRMGTDPALDPIRKHPRVAALFAERP